MPNPNVRPSVQHLAGAPPEDRDLLEKVMACVDTFEAGIGRDFREASMRRYMQYRGFKKWRDAWTAAGPNDKDGVVYDAKKHWGAHLHIPLSYRTIETLVPAAISNAPKLLILPRRPVWEQNVATVKLLIDAQQEQNDIDLPFQAVMRSGRIYGLGVGKTYWRKEWALNRRVKRRMLRRDYVVGDLELEPTFDDPWFEDIDIFDFMWDPYGSDMRTCEWTAHRVWMSTAAVLQRVRWGAWDTESAKLLTEDKVRSLSGSGQRYDEVWQDRMQASGFSSFHMSTRGEQPHEVIEWHDGHRVHTVLDRQVFVVNGENACVGMQPFQVYRPTPLQKQMVGIGDLEPLEHLQRELDTLRSQRRDAATLALAAGYAFDSAAVDEEDIEFGPNAAIPVTNANPGDALMPLRRQEVPGSGYQEESVIRSDFDIVAGIQEGLDQPGGVAGTATEAQLVQASLSRRINLGARRFEIEVARNVARCFLKLNQRMILSQRSPIRAPDHGMDFSQAAAESRWQWFDVGPAELRGEYEIMPEGGSMAARNIPQDRQDAVQMMSMFGQNPFVDPRRPLMKALQLFGIEDPQSWLKQDSPPVPQAALDTLAQMGVSPELIQFAVAQAQQQAPQLGPDGMGGPQTADVQAMMAA